MTQQLHRWFWISLISLCLLLFANRSLAHNNFPILNNSHLDGKVANLEISLRQLEREVSQLKTRPQAAPLPQPSPTPIPQGSANRNDPEIENLANLVIELKQDIHDLENRLSQLEP